MNAVKHRIKGVSLAIATLAFVTAQPAFAQRANLSFETASGENPDRPRDWKFSGSGFQASLDSSARDGKRSLRLTTSRAGSAGVSQSLATAGLNARRVRLSGYVRTRDAIGGTAGLSMVVWSANELPLYFESMAGTGASGTQEWTRYEIELPLPRDAARIDFGAQFTGVGTAWFDAFALEVVTDTAISDSVRAYVENALDLMEQHNIRRDSINWVLFRAFAWEQVRGTTRVAGLYPVLEMLVTRMGDRHSHFVRPRTTTRSALATPTGELVGDRVGYLHVPEFASAEPTQSTAYADALTQSIRDLDVRGVCGWIVDLRNNTGGNMWPMIAGLGPLIGQGVLGWFVSPDGSRESWGYQAGASLHGGEPRARVSGSEYVVRVNDPPVAVLTNRRTASSGEAVTIAFRGRPNTRSFGAPTSGQSTSNRSFQLPDGARLVITTSVMADRTGKMYGGVVAPDVALPGAVAAPPASGDTIALAARTWVEAHPACMNSTPHPRR